MSTYEKLALQLTSYSGLKHSTTVLHGPLANTLAANIVNCMLPQILNTFNIMCDEKLKFKYEKYFTIIVLNKNQIVSFIFIKILFQCYYIVLICQLNSNFVPIM